MRNQGKTQREVIEVKEYEILYDTGEARKLVAQINRMAKEGWQAKSIGALGAPTGVRAVYVLMEREVRSELLFFSCACVRPEQVGFCLQQHANEFD
jgi:hypothetical protein